MEVGPIYGVELLNSLPLDGGMRQALPSAEDLRIVRNVCERTVAGYEVLLEHYRRLQAIVDKLPKDADDDPIEDCRSYFFPCSNGAIEFIAYLGPRCSGDSPTPYPWGKTHKTREAAEKAGKG